MILFLYPTSSYGEAYIYDVHVCLLLSSHIGARIYISWLGRKICTSIQLGCGSEIAFSSDSILLFRKEILTEAPENDRFHWRKYGEKNILNAEYPRYVYLSWSFMAHHPHSSNSLFSRFITGQIMNIMPIHFLMSNNSEKNILATSVLKSTPLQKKNLLHGGTYLYSIKSRHELSWIHVFSSL